MDTAPLPLAVVARPSRHWLGEPAPGYAEHHWPAITTCGCGDFGCGGVGARGSLSDDTVVWSDVADAGWMTNGLWDADYPTSPGAAPATPRSARSASPATSTRTPWSRSPAA